MDFDSETRCKCDIADRLNAEFGSLHPRDAFAESVSLLLDVTIGVVAGGIGLDPHAPGSSERVAAFRIELERAVLGFTDGGQKCPRSFPR